MPEALKPQTHPSPTHHHETELSSVFIKKMAMETGELVVPVPSSSDKP